MTPDNDYDSRMYEDIREIKECVKVLQILLIGNGKVGLCEQMRDAVRCSAENDTRSARQWKIFLVAISLLSLTLLWHCAGGNPASIPGVVLKIIAGM